MSSKINLDTSVQVVASIAVIVGLGLVIWELRQNREATIAQLTSDGVALVSSVNTAVMGEQTANVLAKACDEPQQLTTADYYVLENYYSEILNRYRRIALLLERGSFYNNSSLDTGMGLGSVFDSAPGRAFLKTYGVADEQIGKIIEAKIDDWDGVTCAKFHSDWRKAVEKELEM